MADNVVLLYPTCSEEFHRAKNAFYVRDIEPQKPLSEEDLQAYNEYVDRHPHEFGWG